MCSKASPATTEDLKAHLEALMVQYAPACKGTSSTAHITKVIEEVSGRQVKLYIVRRLCDGCATIWVMTPVVFTLLRSTDYAASGPSRSVSSG